MRPILRVINNKTCELNTLFIQPTNWCAKNCKGCYVKRYEGSNEQISLHTLLNLFDTFYYGMNNCWANQITVSIDEKPSDNNNRNSIMSNIFHGILERINRDTRKDKPEIHFTFNSYKTMIDYANSLSLQHVKWIYKLGLISISNIEIEELEHIKRCIDNGAKIKYNHIVPSKITTNTIDKYVDTIRKIGEVVNSIYLILYKDERETEFQKKN